VTSSPVPGFRCGRGAWVAALCAATLTGCGATVPGQPAAASGSSSVAARDPEAILRDRPPFEAAQQQYLAAVTDTANQITALVPGLTWHVEENSWRGCGGEFLHTKGVNAYVFAVFSGPTPDPVWRRALQIVKDTAGRVGATDVQPFVDRPGNHDLVITGPDGVEVEFGTAKATVLSMSSDCRLRQQTPPR
jgi:predicted LppA-like lipoprotein